MANLMTVPRLVAVDGDGLAMAGALLYFYVTGTSTPKDVYTDSGGGTPFTQPVEADTDGLFPAIYLGTGDYKIILKTSAGVTVWTTDPMSGTSAVDTLTTRGDLLTRDASGYTRLAIGTSGFILRSNGLQPEWSRELVPYGVITGLTFANNASDATNDIDIATGAAMDSSNAKMLVLGSALTKRLDASWAVGTNQGGLDTGSIADTDYFIWLIYRSDTEVVDVLFSTSATSPTMPTNYNYRRLIGWFQRASAAIVAFHAYETAGGGVEVAWDAPTVDVSAATIGTSRSLQTVRAPVGLSVTVNLAVSLTFANGDAKHLNIACPDQTNAGVNATTAVQGTAGFVQTISLTAGAQSISDNTGTIAWHQRVRTNTSAQVAMRASGASATVSASTIGFEWARR